MIRSLSAPLWLVALSLAASAQSKVAVVNLQRALLETAEIKKASAALEAKYKPRQTEIEKIRKDLEDIQQKLQTMAGKLTPQAESEMTVTGQRKQRDLQRKDEDLRAEVDQERNDILTKSGQRMQEVVKKLAEEKAVDVVIDASNTVYFKPALELTQEAIAAYDKAYPVK
ncbi:MAG: OmpH family outer membrane protein [Acidobacteriota bacterium]